jgi:hypothetical protein
MHNSISNLWREVLSIVQIDMLLNNLVSSTHLLAPVVKLSIKGCILSQK